MVLVIGPAESKLADMGTTPCWGMRPIVGLIVYNAARPAGQTSDPLVSVPMAIGAYPAETPTAEPDEDPDGFWGLSALLRGVCNQPRHKYVEVVGR